MRFHLVLVSILSIVLLSCAKEETPVVSQEFDQLSVFYQPDSREVYNNLSERQKKAIWTLKIDNVLANKSLNAEQRSAIENVKSAWVRYPKLELNREVRNALIGVAYTVHEYDLVAMFTTLQKFSIDRNLHTPEIICERCIQELSDVAADSKNNLFKTDNGEVGDEEKKDCNCRWTCSLQEVFGSGCGSDGDATSDCKKVKGCGWFGSEECDERC